jgi:hypothetical protein
MGLAQPTNVAMPDRARPRQQRPVSSLTGNANKDGERGLPLAEYQQKRKSPTEMAGQTERGAVPQTTMLRAVRFLLATTA